jgi:geranylgeranyl transferase type-1 subunit beta
MQVVASGVEVERKRMPVIVSGAVLRSRYPIILFPQNTLAITVSQMLGADEFVDTHSLASFLASCQFKYGGIAKATGEHPGLSPFLRLRSLSSADILWFCKDPYHTYLSLAALSMYPPHLDRMNTNAASWDFEPLDPLLNARGETATWARQYIPGNK